MNYKLIYEKIIAHARNRSILTGYKENHHILPRCMGGGDDENNIVALTPEEHYICHQLLVKIYPYQKSLWRAVRMMTYVSNSTKCRNSNKLYGWLKRKNKWVNRIIITCKFCNKQITVLACHRRQFCSVSCKYKSQEKRIIKNCEKCNKEFFLLPTMGYRKYCSPKCSSDSQIKQITKNCLMCGKQFVGAPHIVKRQTFCSLGCACNYRKGKKRFVPERVLLIAKPCRHCGKPMYGKPGILKQKKSCSRSCGAKHRWIKPQEILV